MRAELQKGRCGCSRNTLHLYDYVYTSNPRAPLAGGSSVCSVGYLCSEGYCENSAVKMPFVTHLYAMTCTHRNRRTHYMTNTVIMTDAISNGAAKPYPLGRYDRT